MLKRQSITKNTKTNEGQKRPMKHETNVVISDEFQTIAEYNMNHFQFNNESFIL